MLKDPKTNTAKTAVEENKPKPLPDTCPYQDEIKSAVAKVLGVADSRIKVKHENEGEGLDEKVIYTFHEKPLQAEGADETTSGGTRQKKPDLCGRLFKEICDKSRFQPSLKELDRRLSGGDAKFVANRLQG